MSFSTSRLFDPVERFVCGKFLNAFNSFLGRGEGSDYFCSYLILLFNLDIIL